MANALDSHQNTWFVGLGGRVKLRPTVFGVVEVAPRLSGHSPGDALWGAALEKQTRGHIFQLTVTNGLATTASQIARGGDRTSVYLGFNLARRF